MKGSNPTLAFFQKLRVVSNITIFIALTLFTISNFGSSQQAEAQNDDSFVFLPIVINPLTQVEITNLVINQGAQSDSHDVPLILNRPALVRVFAEDNALADITIQLEVRSGSRVKGVLTQTKDAPAIATNGNLDSTFNFKIPQEWFDEAVTFKATVVDGLGEFSRSPTANIVPSLDLKLVPIDYTHKGTLIPGIREDHVSDWVYRVFPLAAVDTSIRSQNLPFSGDLTFFDDGDWDRLLDNLIALKKADNAPESQVYLGMIPEYDPNTDNAGLAPLQRAALSTDFGPLTDFDNRTGDVAAHEIAHTMKREHANCGSPGNLDPNYPDPNGLTISYGYDLVTDELKLPTLPDFMSYCNPNWVSAYTFNGLLKDQLQNGRTPERSVADALLVRIRFTKDKAVFAPVYQLETGLDQPAGAEGYSIELRGVDGNILGSHPVDLIVSGHGHVHGGRSIVTTIPAPNAPVASIILLHKNIQVATHRMQSSARTAVLEAAIKPLEKNDFIISWNAAAGPVTLRHRSLLGEWTTLVFDAEGGRYIARNLHKGVIEIYGADSAQTVEIELP